MPTGELALDIEPAAQHILIVLFFAHALLDRYLPPEEHWGATPFASVLIGAIAALCFFEPVGLLAGLFVGIGYAIIRWFRGRVAADGAATFIGGQVASILILIIFVSSLATDDSGAWLQELSGLPLQAVAILTGLLFMWWTGSTAVELLVKNLDVKLPVAVKDEAVNDEAIPNAGRLIGQLERTLILFLVIAGVPSGIGFLIAAKSVLRFGDVTAEGADNRKMAEYVIIGTLASFTFAIPVAYATVTLVRWAQ